MQIKLRPYQENSIEKLRANFKKNVMNQLLNLPTGAGKTVIAAFMLLGAYEKGKRAIFVCDRISLINQTSDLLDSYGIPHGVIQSNHWRYRPYERIQVASAQTLARRQWPDTDLIIVDEAHTIQTTVKNQITQRNIFCIGLTATPFTKGLGRLYDDIVTVTTMNNLTNEDYLVPFKVFAASEPDMSGAKIVAGEWTEAEAEKRALPIVGDCVREYLKHGKDLKFICFGVNVKHCEELQRQFMNSGVLVELYTYKQGDETRAEILTEFRKPDSTIKGLISVSALSKGFDVPDIGVVILARPLRNSISEHIQMLGRGLRPHPGKECCIVLDHAGNTLRFYERMMDFFEDGLDELDDGKPKKKAEAKPPKTPKPLKCPQCAQIHAPMKSCPSCGFIYQSRSDIEHLEGELIEFGSKRISSKDKARIFAELKQLAIDRNWKPYRETMIFKNVFGVWPNKYKNVEPLPPSDETKSIVRIQSRAYAKMMKKKGVA